MARRSQHTQQQLREMIIDAAHNLIESGGAGELSAREIARMVGYAPGTLYNAFESLDDIVLRVEARMLEELDGKLRSAMEGSTGCEAIGRFARVYLRFAHERVRLWRLLNEHRPATTGTRPNWYSDALSAVVRKLEGPIGTLMPDADQAEVSQATRVLWASIHGMAVNSTCEKMGYLTLEAALLHQQVFLDVYLRGLRGEKQERCVQLNGGQGYESGQPA